MGVASTSETCSESFDRHSLFWVAAHFQTCFNLQIPVANPNKMPVIYQFHDAEVWVAGDPDFSVVELIDHGHLVRVGHRYLKIEACLEVSGDPEEGVTIE